ncbi:hypothetical protein RclHR1_02270008 [Rhizophagus clarus]|uniref:Uncharacterized protein n=1 Tax=Rhizophagus clarus TaxID=94130 RepID=A0A2Z6R876_9GLOM|nr:hypothetical protein RclHR1_02270008 [Rhizophagus clarus]GET01742.1 hypothetical protein RCL_jg7597.t1 [Rhizophagus clarus]
MIAYFKSWEDLQNIINKELFWNRVKLSWYCHTILSFITRKRSSQRFNSNGQDKSSKSNLDSSFKHTKVTLGFETSSSATGSNRMLIRSLQKNSSQSSSEHKTGRKNKKNQNKNDKSTGLSSQRCCLNNNCMLRL